MRKILFVFLLLSLSNCIQKKDNESEAFRGEGIENAEKEGIVLSVHSNNFQEQTLIEVLEKVQEIEVNHIEVSIGHTLGGKWGDQKFDLNLPQEECNELKEIAKKHNIKISSIGVFSTNNISDWEKVFALAQNMEMEYITCAPKTEHLSEVEKLAKETNIKVAIYNNLAPSDYADPSNFMLHIKNHSELLGACASIGNWVKDGRDEIECMDTISNRLIAIHLNDLDQRKYNGDYQIDCIWGSGEVDIDAIVRELKKTNYKGYITLIHKTGAEDPLPYLKDDLFYFELVTRGLYTNN